MIRLFLIEWIKLRNYRAFKVLVILYFLVLGVVCSSGMFILQYLKSKGAEWNNIDPTILPIYHFPDIWQNVTQIASWLKIILGFIVIISITNEITYKTLRQNVIDGVNRMEFISSKLLMILGFSLANALFVFLTCLILGFIYSPQVNLSLIVSGSQFIGGFFLTTFAYLVFAFLIGILIKRTGIAIVFLGIYAPFIDPITSLIFANAPGIPLFLKHMVPFFPMEAISNIIRDPFARYAFRDIQDYVSLTDVSIVLAQVLVYFGIIFLLLRKKDL